MYLYKDLWKIWLQHLWNHYVTTLSTVRETCVHIEQGISAHMVRWDLNEGLVFVRRSVRGLVLTSRYQSKRLELVYIHWFRQSWKCGLTPFLWTDVRYFPFRQLYVGVMRNELYVVLYRQLIDERSGECSSSSCRGPLYRWDTTALLV